MDYQAAHNYIFNEIGDEGFTILNLLADDNIAEGIALIKELTLCDDNTAKLIWCDLKIEYGTKENNPILQAREEYEKDKQIQEYQYRNIPKCPTCGSTNIEKISATSKAIGAVAFGLFSKTAKSQFKCRNCGYKW